MIGKTFSHYKILKKIGEGGMGVLYKARDTSLNRFVALKFLPAHLTKDESTRKRFIVEAQAASALDHPNICNIHEINETPDGQLYICMAYYEGVSLKEKIDKGPIPFNEAIKIFSKIAQGLKTAHEKKIIHRDIKPGNIIITDKGEVKIVDFGLAKLAGEKLTESFSTKGTIAYMAPEVIRGSKADNRADLWSLGVMLYEMITGHLPFRGEYPEPLIYSIVNEKPKSLSHYLKDVPELLQTIIDKLLKKDPTERYQQLSNLLFDSKSLIKEDRIVVIKPWPAFIQLLSRKKAYLYASLAILLVILFLMIARPYLFPEQREEIKIAVLPMESIISDPEQERFNVSMTEELITKLGQIRGLLVKGRFSSRQYIGTTKTTSQIASELGVHYILENSSAIVDDQVFLKPRLLDAIKDEYILMQEYKRNIENILGLQGLIAIEIADKIGVKPTAVEETRLSVKRAVNPETYKLYMEGMYYLNQKTPDGIEKGMELLRQAVEKDPTEPLAHAHYALGLSEMTHSPKPIPGAAEKINESALKALELDYNLAEAHLALAMVKIYDDRDIIGAGQSYRRALELNPDLPLALYHYAWFQLLLGNYEEGPRLLKRAIEVEPFSHIYPLQLAFMYYFLDEFDKTIEYAQKSLAWEPDDFHTLFVLGAGYAGKSMYDKAIAVQKRSVDLAPYFEYGLAHTYAISGYKEDALKIASKLKKRNDIWDTLGLAIIYSAIGDADKMFYWLDQADLRGHVWIMWIGRPSDIYFGAFKEDPRYQDLAQRLNFPK
jgi:serine/threonine protein kinase